MSKKYFCAYYSYLDSMETLTDEERGRLFTACLIYGKTGQVPDLPGHEKHVFPSFKSQIDRDNKEYDSYCESQKERAKKSLQTAITRIQYSENCFLTGKICYRFITQ